MTDRSNITEQDLRFNASRQELETAEPTVPAIALTAIAESSGILSLTGTVASRTLVVDLWIGSGWTVSQLRAPDDGLSLPTRLAPTQLVPMVIASIVRELIGTLPVGAASSGRSVAGIAELAAAVDSSSEERLLVASSRAKDAQFVVVADASGVLTFATIGSLTDPFDLVPMSAARAVAAIVGLALPGNGSTA